ncbi:TIP41-like protein isoform X3 [Hydra vulgaris]|uniref:TIP41-like protein n=1 Tax=Hydra vulgaris TaxID=6087 RepID=A0ABM4BJC9_HYDVU
MASKPKEERISFGQWNIIAQKGPILSSSDSDRISNELNLPSLPEMVFGETFLRIDHDDGFSICFNALDALKLVDNKNDLLKVGVAEEWRKYRADNEFIDDIVNPFDWTFTTNYMGTLVPSHQNKIVATEERINLEKLRQRESIAFYQDLLLFEDELADHGMVTLSVKIRVMPSSFFVLQRFFLRVDGVIIRMNDTRLYYEMGNNFILREYSSREKKIKDIPNPLLDPSELAEQLDLVSETVCKLEL